MATKYTQHIQTRPRAGQSVPQTQPLPGQSPNNAGGYSFTLDPWARLKSFLILGTEGGTYYVRERKLTEQNYENVLACIQTDGRRAVDTIVSVSEGGLAPKNDPAIFALALAASKGAETTRAYALANMNKVCRIGTHLFQFAESVRELRGWSKAVSRAFMHWYTDRTKQALAHQLIKYQNRNGWRHRDILRLCHPNVKHDPVLNSMFYWAVKGPGDAVNRIPEDAALKILWAFEKAKEASESELLSLVADYRLPWEAIPTEKRTPAVWEAILPHMGLTAVIRNLGALTSNGVLANRAMVKTVVERLGSEDAIRGARVHPLAILVGLNTYSGGHGIRGSLSWSPVPDIVDALDSAFYLAFNTVKPTNKRFLLGLDVSGSMMGPPIAGMPGVSPRAGTAAMAMVTHAVERDCMSMAFCGDFVKFDLSRKVRLDSVCRRMNGLSFGATDCSLPMIYAQKNKLDIDAFVVYTDSETYAGRSHPATELQRYRDKTGIPAKLIVVGMTSTGFTIADPKDPGMLDVVGFSTDAPAVMSAFVGD